MLRGIYGVYVLEKFRIQDAFRWKVYTPLSFLAKTLLTLEETFKFSSVQSAYRGRL